MRIYRLIAAFAFLAAITVLPAYAQPKTATAPQTAPAGAGGGAVPDSKIAIIFTDAFLDPKNGITRINNLAASLDREFQPRRTELQGMQTRVQQLTDSISKLQQSQNVVDPKSIQTQIDQLDTLKKDFQRKAEDAQAAFTKRQQEVLGPLQDDIGKALEAYAKTHGITVLIDASRVPLVYAADNLDITRAFIAEYNSRNPGTASAR
jgi:Skp family chaperone for outer membrane proteins